MLRFLTAGESHGQALVAILEGVPAGLAIDFDAITAELRRRQGGYGRGRRMAIESDRADAISGIRHGVSTGGPIALMIPNKDWENWQRTMYVRAEQPADASGAERPAVTRPRPGHADLAGAVKYAHDDIRDVLERASARETAARVAVGTIARQLLRVFGTEIASHVFSIGAVSLPDHLALTFADVRAIPADRPLRCADVALEQQMMAEIDRAREAGDTTGGSFEVIAHNVPVGLGSYVQWDRKLDGRLAQAVMSINAIKAVEFGAGFEGAARRGSEFHDQIDYQEGRFRHLTNRAGGITGGVTNGESIDLRVAIKPISTMKKPMQSIDLKTKEKTEAHYERSDVCVVPAAGVIGEAVVALTLAEAFLEKFGGDSMVELERNYRSFMESIAQ